MAASRLTLLHHAWRLLPATPRRRLLSRATAWLAPRAAVAPLPGDGGAIVAGALSQASGLGEGARLMLRALQASGIAAWPLDIGDAMAPVAVAQAPHAAPGAPLILHVNAPTLPLALLRLPRGVARRRRVIGYWAWELPSAPPDWRDGARCVHQAWVPSRFTADALAPLLPGRVRVVPHPLALAPPLPAPLDRAAFGWTADAVVVLVSLSLASSFARKNPLAAIAAFRAAFGARADRLLVLRIGHAEHYGTDLAMLRAAVAGAANIVIDTRALPAADAHAMTAAADIVLSLHRAEGFGLVPAEAMLLGRAVVATGWSGNMDFMDADSAALVGYRLVPARDPRGVYDFPASRWAEPEQADAVAHLRRLADDAAARVALGARGRATASARLGAAPLLAALAEIGVVPA